MAIIQSVNGLINRIRTILDKGDSPWMSDAEIDDFVSMAASEFTQERVDKFGATQRIRDDLGGFVRRLVFFDSHNLSFLEEFFLLQNAQMGGGQMDQGPLSWLNVATIFGAEDESGDFGNEVWPLTYNESPISPISCDMTFDGPFYGVGSESAPLPPFLFGKPDVNTVISINIHWFNTSFLSGQDGDYVSKRRVEPVKIISIDDYQGSINDPFNVPDINNRVAVRTGTHYTILPNEDIHPFGLNIPAGGESDFGLIVFNYVSGQCTTENIIKHMPKSSIEEICQIAARKILGTTADERYPIGDAEINQLNR